MAEYTPHLFPEMDPTCKFKSYNWLEKDAPKIKDYFWKEWDAETTAKVNANLATYTSGYVAPRTTTAQAQETVTAATTPSPTTSSPVNTAPAVEPESIPTYTGEDMPDFSNGDDATDVSTENDDWINSVLNG